METKWIHIKEEELACEAVKKEIDRAGRIIKEGGLVAFPTETVYGLGGDALNSDASRKIYAAKGRPSDNPLIVHIADTQSLQEITDRIPESAKVLMEHFWPGPLTMIFPKNDRVPKETTGGLDTVAVRFPCDDVALAFIKAAGGFVAAPSANLSGRPSPTTGAHVYEDLNGKIEMILDSGKAGIGLESTIVDLTGEIPVILRPGYITEEMLTEVLGRVENDPTILNVSEGIRPKAPGMKYKHYAPRGELTIVSGEDEAVTAYINEQIRRRKEEGFCVGVIGTKERIDRYESCVHKNIGSRKDEAAVARNLYEILREFDTEQVDYMYTESFATDGIGQAIMNRLLKAAGHRVVEV